MITNRSGRGLAAAVRALLVLVEAPRGMATSAEVAKATTSHPVVVRRLLARLRSDGLVESRSGPNGGWAIAKDPALIRVGDVHRALAEPRDSVESALLALLAAAEDAFVGQLDRVTLADLASPEQRPRQPHS